MASEKAEFGPRALGNRSLLADCRNDTIKDKVNKIKHRQNRNEQNIRKKKQT